MKTENKTAGAATPAERDLVDPPALATDETLNIVTSAGKVKRTPHSILFLHAFHGPGALLPMTVIHRDKRIEARSFDDEKLCEDWIAAKQRAEFNIYFNPATPKDRLTKKATKEDIKETWWLWTDPDPVKLSDERAKDLGEQERRSYYLGERVEILTSIENLPLRPTVVVDSGNGYQCFWKLKQPMPCGTPGEIAAVEGRNRWLGTFFGGRADNTHNVDRIMRVPGTTNFPNDKKIRAGITWTAEAKQEPGRADFQLEYDPGDFQVVEASGAKPRAQPLTLPAVTPPLASIPQLQPDNRARLRRLIETGADPDRQQPFRSRSEALFAAVCGMLRAGCDDSTVVAVITDSRNRISDSVLDKGARAGDYAARQVKNARAKDADFIESKNGIAGNYQNARLAILKLGLVCEYDSFADQMRVAGHAMQQWQGDLTDNAAAILRQIIVDRWGFDPKPQHVRDAAVALCLENTHNPVCERLDRLQRQWDKVKRLDTWLTQYMGAEDTPLNRAIGKRVLVAAVRRARRPGVKFDHVLVFEDPVQGTGKSSAVKILAGEEHFSDEELLGLDKKARIEALQGVWIFELGELSGLENADLKSIKGFITRTEDQVRPAYGRFKQRWKRQCIFIGSTNESGYLLDTTGNRRWWPVATGAIELKALAEDVDQLWAEAAQEETAGFDITLPRHLWDAAKLEQDKRTPPPRWMEMLSGVRGRLYTNDEGQQVERITSKELMTEHLKIPAERQSGRAPKDLKAAMEKLGWQHSGESPMAFGDVRAVGYWRWPDAQESTSEAGDGSAPF